MQDMPKEIDMMLSAVRATDGAREIAEEGAGGTGGGATVRDFSQGGGFGVAWQEWAAFCDRVNSGEAYASCVVDFRYTDKGRLKGKDQQLERAYCFHDPKTASPDEKLVLIHTHTTHRWDDRKTLTVGPRLQKLTSVNVRHAHKSQDAGSFRQEEGNRSFRVVPGNAKLANEWRNMPESEIVWGLGAHGAPATLPPLDSGFNWRYNGVASVISAGENLCREAFLADSIHDTQTMMRGGEEVEYEVVACLDQQDRGKARWGGLRVFGLCIGVDKYEHHPNLGNAVRDAEAFSSKLNSMPGCLSVVIRNPAEAKDVLKSIRRHLQDADMLRDPPEIIIIYFAGHGIQPGQKVYLVPGKAVLDVVDELDMECLSVEKLLQSLRTYFDEKVQEQNGTAKAPAFLLALDSCRVDLERGLSEALALEPSKDSAPRKWNILFSCSRTATASDGPTNGHSPFASALLHPENGLFAEGVTVNDAISNMCESLEGRGQKPMQAGHPACIPAGFCMLPATKAPSVSAAVSSPHKVPSGGPQVDAELMRMLREWDLEDVAGVLAEHGFETRKRMMMMEEEDINELGLRRGDLRLLRKFLQSLRKEAEKGTTQAQGTNALEVPILCVSS